MTILKPALYQEYIRLFLVGFFLFLSAGIVYIFSYNAVVDVRFEIQTFKEEIVEFQAKNADLKNAVYTIVDPSGLEELALNRGLILDRNPEYLNNYKWLSDSSF